MKNSLPSPRQQALLTFIDGFINEHRYAPSYREVMRALDYKSVSTVAKHIEGLIERGWLVKSDKSARSVEVVHGGKGTADADTSPAPALPVSHEEWLAGLIDARLVDGADSLLGSDRDALVATLRVLGLVGLAERYDTSRKG